MDLGAFLGGLILKKIFFVVAFLFFFNSFSSFEVLASSDIKATNGDKYYIYNKGSCKDCHTIYTYNSPGTFTSNGLYKVLSLNQYTFVKGKWEHNSHNSILFEVDNISDTSYLAVVTNDREYYNALIDVGYDKVTYDVPPLVGAMEGVEMGAVLKIILEVTPMVVLSIVSYLGLRKAFRFCLLQLKQS